MTVASVERERAIERLRTKHHQLMHSFGFGKDGAVREAVLEVEGQLADIGAPMAECETYAASVAAALTKPTQPARFVSPCPPPGAVETEIITTLIEEAAEVIQRGTKLNRFGIEEVQPGQDLTNAQRLAHEIGDFLGMIEIALKAGIIDNNEIEVGRVRKHARFEKYRQHRPEVTP